MHTRVRISRVLLTAILAALLLVPAIGASTGIARAAEGNSGAVYVLSNSPAGNAVLAFNRSADGSLSAAGSFATGGLGTGSGLGSQGAIAMSADNRWVAGVNAGSNDISIFAVQPGSLVLADKVGSGGSLPISLTIYKDLLYVLNAGGSGNITGFRISPAGKLAPIAGATAVLSNGGAGAAPGPAQVSFSPDGNWLVVTEKASNLIDVYSVNADGTASGPTVYASSGATPFGFGFGHNNTLIVSEAFGGAPLGSAVSSYQLSAAGLAPVSPSAATYQTAACWIVVTQNGNFAYTTNAGSGTISGYRVGNDGSLALLDATGVTGVMGANSAPIDMALSINSQYLYALGAASHAIHPFMVNSDGSLIALDTVSLPTGIAGIAAR